MCEERFGTSKTPFTGVIASSTPALYLCMGFGLFLFVGLIADDFVSIFQVDQEQGAAPTWP